MLFARIIFIFAIFGIMGINAYIEFNNVNCNARDKEFAEFEYCFLKSFNRTYKYLSLKGKLHQVPVRNAKITFQILKRDTRNIFEHYNGSINACKFLRDGLQPIASIIYKTFKPYSNINHTCPFNHDLIVEKLPIQHVNSIVNPIMSSGRYLLNLTFYNNDIPRSDIIVYFSKS